MVFVPNIRPYIQSYMYINICMYNNSGSQLANGLESYLTNRKQFAEIKDAKSKTLCIECGVPQGLILGPLLYLLYVNDICFASDCNILSFADDT